MEKPLHRRLFAPQQVSAGNKRVPHGSRGV